VKKVLGFCLVFLSSLSVTRAIDWKPVDPADLALKSPRVDPAADAEALFWDMWIADEAANNQYPFTTYSHYLRIKIFTDRGVKRFGTVDIEYHGKENITEIAGRTIRPDGSIQELGHDAILNRVIEKKKHEKAHAVSFAMPGVSVGSIIEYRWREYDTDSLANYVPLFAYRDIPVEHLTFHLKPLNSPYFPYTMKYRPFHVNLPPFKADSRGWFVSQLDNLAAFQEEEDAPPSSETCPWILIYYAEDHKENLDHYWKTEGKRLAALYHDQIKVNGDVKSIAQEVTSGAKSPEEKLKLLTIYCQKKIKNVLSDETSDIDRQNFKPDRNSVDTLKRGIGTATDIRMAFAALAEAAGFDARLAFLCDRQTMIFHRELMIPFLPKTDIAVDVNGKWKLYDVTSRFLEPGHLRWQEEGVSVLIADGKEPAWIATEFTPSDLSQYKHQGHVKLDEQGTLEGDLYDTLTGHPAEEWRETFSRSSTADRDKRLTEAIGLRLPGAEITELKSSEPGDLSSPVSIQYHIKVPGYATRTGKRLFFAPAVFETNEPARYTTSTRKFDIMFRYPWSEQEDISIKTPAGYELDHADAPRGLSFGPVGAYQVKIAQLPDRLYYHRELDFAKNGAIYYPSSGYTAIKQAFDAIHDRDTHLLTLKVQQTMAAVPASN
jgi:Domain of Unknown Function with PDB structure (DUF3857)/Transglutaminase-like superfamily